LARDKSSKRKKVLFVDHYLPHFDQDAGSKAAYQYLKILLKGGYKVYFVGDNFWHYPQTPYLEALTQLGIEVLYGNCMPRTGRDGSKKMENISTTPYSRDRTSQINISIR